MDNNVTKMAQVYPVISWTSQSSKHSRARDVTHGRGLAQDLQGLGLKLSTVEEMEGRTDGGGREGSRRKKKKEAEMTIPVQ